MIDRSWQRRVAALSLLTLGLTGAALGAEPSNGAEYSIIPLEATDGPVTRIYQPLGMNNRGAVVGTAAAADGQHGAVWRNGKLVDLGLGYTPWSINDAGQVLLAGQGGVFLWTEGNLQAVGCAAYRLNDRGDAVGRGLGSASNRACLWKDGSAIDLGALGPDTTGSLASVAWSLNNAGDVVGMSSSPSGTRAFLWSKGVMISAGTLGSESPEDNVSSAADVSNSGLILGASSNSQGFRSFLWDGRSPLRDLGSLPYYPPTQQIQGIAVNSRGQVVGLANRGTGFFPSARRQVAFLWDARHGFRELSSLLTSNSGWSLIEQVADINDRGQIVGYGVLDGRGASYLMTPLAAAE
jgi:probable HAF family extracellular repeat protein